MTLTEFLLARIAEDEVDAVLTESAPPKWQMTTYPHDGEPIAVDVPALTPARVLAECEAKRRIVQHAGRWEVVSVEDGRRLHHPIMLALAAVYSDHPDYREEWRP